jgi:hypothetical protein
MGKREREGERVIIGVITQRINTGVNVWGVITGVITQKVNTSINV